MMKMFLKMDIQVFGVHTGTKILDGVISVVIVLIRIHNVRVKKARYNLLKKNMNGKYNRRKLLKTNKLIRIIRKYIRRRGESKSQVLRALNLNLNLILSKVVSQMINMEVMILGLDIKGKRRDK